MASGELQEVLTSFGGGGSVAEVRRVYAVVHGLLCYSFQLFAGNSINDGKAGWNFDYRVCESKTIRT